MPLAGIQLTRMLQARRERVFRAWTRPELMARWFFPGEGWACSVTAELREGGRWEVVMTDDVVDSVVTLELRELARGTELTLTHELPADPKVRQGHEEGWEGCLGNLAKHLLDIQEGDET
jgi:uncharacterized protein YndB with AHSA1/START domain